MIESILSSLFFASVCATGAFFLKWLEGKKTIQQLKDKITGLQKTTDQLQATILDLQKENAELKAENAALHAKPIGFAQSVSIRQPRTPLM